MIFVPGSRLLLLKIQGQTWSLHPLVIQDDSFYRHCNHAFYLSVYVLFCFGDYQAILVCCV